MTCTGVQRRRVARSQMVCALALLALATPAAAQLQPMTFAAGRPKGLPDGEYYSLSRVPFPGSRSLGGLLFYRKETDGNLYPWLCNIPQLTRDSKLDDCTWQPIESVGPVSFAEADAAAQATATDPFAPTDGPVQYWRGFKDLLPDAKARGRWGPLAAGVGDQRMPIKNIMAHKRVLLALSSDSAVAFDRFGKLQELLGSVGTWASYATESPAVRAAASELTQMNPMELVAANVMQALKQRHAAVTYAEDLSQFRSSAYDFAMVVDVEIATDAGPFVKVLQGVATGQAKFTQNDVIESPVRASLNWVVIDPNLRVVTSMLGQPLPVPADGLHGVDLNVFSPADAVAFEFHGLADALTRFFGSEPLGIMGTALPSD